MAASKDQAGWDAITDEAFDETPAENQIIFDTDGDTFTGRFVGWSESEGRGIPQAHFEDQEGGRYFVNCGWSLKNGLKPVPANGTRLVRMTRTGSQNTGQKSDMVLFRVQSKEL